MTDRELLEAAAKAAGIGVVWNPDVNQWYHKPRPLSWAAQLWWNPLTDDGDALRLAVKLKLHVCYSGGNQYFAGPSDSDKHGMRESGERNGVQDPYAATRRAIVRAAAAMAKAS